MRILTCCFLLFLSAPALSQPVLTITDARHSSPIAPYAYYLEDLTHKLTYEQISHLPLNSFKPVNRQGAIQMGIRLGTIWLRLQVENRTGAELFLFSSQWKYKRMDVYVLDENGQLTLNHGESQLPFANRLAPITQPIVSIGNHPRMVHLALLLSPQDFLNDYLQLTSMGYAMLYQKETTFWQGGLVGVYLLTFLFALVLFFRLRDPLIGWYAVFIYVSAYWFLDRSGYLFEFFGQDSWYARTRSYYPVHLIFVGVWAIFLVRLIELRTYSKFLYYLNTVSSFRA